MRQLQQLEEFLRRGCKGSGTEFTAAIKGEDDYD